MPTAAPRRAGRGDPRLARRTAGREPDRARTSRTAALAPWHRAPAARGTAAAAARSGWPPRPPRTAAGRRAATPAVRSPPISPRRGTTLHLDATRQAAVAVHAGAMGWGRPCDRRRRHRSVPGQRRAGLIVLDAWAEIVYGVHQMRDAALVLARRSLTGL